MRISDWSSDVCSSDLCIQGNFFPELIVWLCENYDKPESSAQVEKLQKFLTANMDVMHAAYPTIAKYFLCRRAVPRNSFSRQNGGVLDSRSEEHTSELQSLMRI